MVIPVTSTTVLSLQVYGEVVRELCKSSPNCYNTCISIVTYYSKHTVDNKFFRALFCSVGRNNVTFPHNGPPL